MRWFFRLVFLALLCAGGWYGWNWYQARKPPVEGGYRTATVKRGDLLVAIGSTGTVEPEEVVDVGAQVAGKILGFGKDTNGNEIDYGSHIEADQVLANIEDVLYKADLKSAEAQYDQANAGVTRANADLEQAKAKLIQSEAEWKRAQELVADADALTQSEYDTAKANYEIAKANVAVSSASIVQANSSVKQAEAGKFRAERNLNFCVIKSPVSGVIIDRRVNIGQTVVSSLNAPSLFLIAKDMKRMEVWVAVNEADIGQIHQGQKVTFTCDAFPGETFEGSVSKMRLNATMTQNVVTYTVEVTTDNSSNRLLPYLTANVSFEVQKRENVVLVPNTALRFTPSSVAAAAANAPPATASAGSKPPVADAPSDKGSGAAASGAPNAPDPPAASVAEEKNPAEKSAREDAVAAASPENGKSDGKTGGDESVDPSSQPTPGSGREGGGRHRNGGGESGGSGAPGEGGGRRWRGGGNRSGSGGKTATRGQTSGEGTVWVLKGTELQSIKVKTGLTDDTLTEILSDNLPEGTEVLIGEIVADDPNAAATSSTNPFAPPMMGRNRGGMGSGGPGGGNSRRGP